MYYDTEEGSVKPDPVARGLGHTAPGAGLLLDTHAAWNRAPAADDPVVSLAGPCNLVEGLAL